MSNTVFGSSYQRLIEEQKEAQRSQAKWDRRFLAMAELIASWSKDPSTKCGAVIVRPDRTVASVGFNGFPKDCVDDEALYADREEKYARVIHAELNAILFARENVMGYTLYSAVAPCDRCAAHMIQAGIARVVYPRPSEDVLSRWAVTFERAARMFAESGMEVEQLDRV